MTEYGAARTAQLRVFLVIATGLGAWLIIAGVANLMGGVERYFVIVLVAGSLAAAAGVLGVRRLPESSRQAKTTYAAAGALQLLIGLLLAASAIGLIPIVVGILLLLLALTREAEPT